MVCDCANVMNLFIQRASLLRDCREKELLGPGLLSSQEAPKPASQPSSEGEIMPNTPEVRFFMPM